MDAQTPSASYLHPWRIDLPSAVLAGVFSGIIVWLLSHGTPWFTSGLVSPTLMGRNLKPPGVVNPSASVVTVLAQLATSICYGLVIAFLVTPFRRLWALVAGGVVGFGLYGLNFLVFHLIQDVTWSTAEWAVIVTHFVFSIVAAGLYKGLAAGRRAPPPVA